MRVMLLDYEVLPENTSRFHDIFAPRLLHTGAPSDVEEVEHRVLHARLSRSTEGGSVQARRTPQSPLRSDADAFWTGRLC